jgi:hypothetical protein
MTGGGFFYVDWWQREVLFAYDAVLGSEVRSYDPYMSSSFDLNFPKAMMPEQPRP